MKLDEINRPLSGIQHYEKVFLKRREEFRVFAKDVNSLILYVPIFHLISLVCFYITDINIDGFVVVLC